MDRKLFRNPERLRVIDAAIKVRFALFTVKIVASTHKEKADAGYYDCRSSV